MTQALHQRAHGVRLEWGPAAIRQLGPEVDCIIVIDVLSFTSCVSVALERGAQIYPYPWRDERAVAYAAAHGAELARRTRGAAQGWSLSPGSLLKAHPGLKLVLPSPNGSSCTFLARDLGKPVYAASLRNLRATATACRRHERLLIVPCGERWGDDDSLRPCLEDHLAAGGLVQALNRQDLSPEARLAVQAYAALSPAERREALAACGSAQELVERGFAADLALCWEEDASDLACRLDGDCFRAERPA